jgi:5'-deoxynucleotidase YfbR-like HD superfamily hydrolase
MTPGEVLVADDKKILALGEQLKVAYKLKKTLRYAGTRDFSVHGESVAEHVFALLYLSQYFLPLEDPDGKMDKTKVYEILLFHDFGEIFGGDVPYHLKTSENQNQEKEDALSVFKSLPSPLSEVGLERWTEYEEKISLEAKFVNALDKIEPIFELLDPVSEKCLKRLKFTYEMHIVKKLKATEIFPVMKKFVNVFSEDMKKRGLFWEEGSQ